MILRSPSSGSPAVHQHKITSAYHDGKVYIAVPLR